MSPKVLTCVNTRSNLKLPTSEIFYFESCDILEEINDKVCDVPAVGIIDIWNSTDHWVHIIALLGLVNVSMHINKPIKHSETKRTINR